MSNCLGTAYTSCIIFEGDSITEGFGVTTAQRYQDKLALRTLSNFNILTGAISGTTTADLSGSGYPYLSNTTRVTKNVTFASGASQKVMSLWIGTNDLHLTTDSAATIMGRITTYINAFKSVGFNKIVLFTILPLDANAAIISTSPGRTTHEARRLQLNDLIRLQRGALINDYVDVGAHPILGNVANTTNTTWFSDGVHLTAAAYDFVVELARPVFTAL